MPLLLLAVLNCSQEPSGPRTPQPEYTRDNPGEWAAIMNDHLPRVRIRPEQPSGNIYVEVPPGKFHTRHYIEKIGLMDENKRDLQVANIGRGKKPLANFHLSPFPSEPWKIKVFVKCNMHDLWTVPLGDLMEPPVKDPELPEE